MKRSEKNDRKDFPDPTPELQAPFFIETHDGPPQLKKPGLRLELKLKQRNKKEIRE